MYEVSDINTYGQTKASGPFPEAFFKDIATFGPGVVVISSSDNKIVYCNEQFEVSTGLSSKELLQISAGIENLIINADLDQLNVQLTTIKNDSNHNKRFGVYRLNTAGNIVKTFFTYLSLFEGKDQQQYYYLTFLTEPSATGFPFISYDTRRMFFEQLENMNFGTFEWLIDVNKILWSDGLYKIYELDDNGTELEIEKIEQFVHPEDKKRVSLAMKKCLEHGEEIALETKIITAKQNIKIVSCTGRMVYNNDGKAIKMIGSVRDFTEQRVAEQNLQRHVKELNRSNQELEEFAYVASHDLQEPLRKITTFGDRLFEKYTDALGEEGNMYMKRIIASAENMRMLINNLLEFSRVTRSTQPFTNTSLNLVVREVKNDLELLVEETATKIDCDKLPNIEASFSQMKQLFTNIINNAIKFRRQNVPSHINITSEQLSEDEKLINHLDVRNKYYKIEITDNGIGFDEEYSVRIFQIFQRLHGKAEYPGSGIGLAICKKIADHHHGLIFATGKEGEGACFTIILPEKQ